MGHQIPHQGFRNRGIDTVHGHVVPVIGGPSQSQLRQIPCANHHAVCLIGQIHKNLGPLSGLGVFIGGIPDCLFMAYILKMPHHRSVDINLTQGYA